MAKFKVGDQVRVISEDEQHRKYWGATGTIQEYDVRSNWYKVNIPLSTGSYFSLWTEDELSLYTTNKSHKHAELIKKWADNQDIKLEWKFEDNDIWFPLEGVPTFYENRFYREKPISQDFVIQMHVRANEKKSMIVPEHPMFGKIANVEFTFYGETGEIKDVKIL